MSEKSDVNPVAGAEMDDAADEGLHGPGNAGAHETMESQERMARHHRNRVMATWIIAVFAAFLLGSTIVNIIVTKWAYEGSQRQVEAISSLTESMKEVQKSIAELSRLIKELPETQQQEEEEPYQRPRIGDENV